MSSQLHVKPIIWSKTSIKLLDQRKLPKIKEYIELQKLEEVIRAIKNMTVRGAPAIAVTGLFGLVLFLKENSSKPHLSKVQDACNVLLSSRPTAVNLKNAVDLFQSKLFPNYENLTIDEVIQISEDVAKSYYEKDVSDNRAIGKNALELFKGQKNLSILTHCNAGAIATTEYGTALGVIRALRDNGHNLTVYIDETRPFLQGSRLTAWEMQEENIESFIITDSMAGWVFQNKKIDAVIVGCDRIASNGDVANKIGTYPLSIVAKEHSVPFYVAGTSSSFDFSIPSGKQIKIEMRDESEVTEFSFLKNTIEKSYFQEGIFAPIGAKALNPSFDITPSKNIRAIIIEKGIISPVTDQQIKKIVFAE